MEGATKFSNAQSRIVLHGQNYDEAAAEAYRLSEEEGLTVIHPFDDPHVIAGQATIGMEIIKQVSSATPLEAIFCCVGGGGLLAGVAAYVKRIRPDVKVIGVEALDAAAMTASLKCNEVVQLDQVGLFCDGAAVKVPGTETFRLCSQYVDEMITVETDDVCAAIKDVFNDTRTIIEPAGALAVAGLKKYVFEHQIEGKKLVAITSGANMDFDRLRFVSERADSSESLVSVIIPERPGSFQQLYSQIFPRNVTEFSYRYSNPEKAYIYLSFQAKNSADRKMVLGNLSQLDGYSVFDLTNNELAKSHGRHLVGGRAPQCGNGEVIEERLVRFEFPERPGALKLFLGHLTSPMWSWNVTLFHYRNHGADVGRVLTGIQVPQEKAAEFDKFLGELGYAYFEESDNPIFDLFLR